MIYGISHKTLIDSKPLRIKFDETDIQQNQISDQAKKLYHIYFSHYFSKIKVDSYPSLPIKKH